MRRPLITTWIGAGLLLGLSLGVGSAEPLVEGLEANLILRIECVTPEEVYVFARSTPEADWTATRRANKTHLVRTMLADVLPEEPIPVNDAVVDAYIARLIDIQDATVVETGIPHLVADGMALTGPEISVYYADLLAYTVVIGRQQPGPADAPLLYALSFDWGAGTEGTLFSLDGYSRRMFEPPIDTGYTPVSMTADHDPPISAAWTEADAALAQHLGDGLFAAIHQTGSGPALEYAQGFTVNYTGYLEDGTVFDSNVLPEFEHVEPFTLQPGEWRLIKGWKLGLPGMQVGERRKLWIPAALAYGDKPREGGKIKPGDNLIFEIELVAIQP